MAFKYKEYDESDEVRRLAAEYEAKRLAAPKAYASANQAQLDDLYKKITNREAFSYDPKGDAFFNQYADLYRRQGKMAAQDTMGQAAALTGGYGNSYATSAANQANNSHLQEMNNIVPELYQLAYSKYQQKGQDLINQYGLLSDKEAQDYGRYQDDVSRYNSDLALLASQLETARDRDYSRYLGDREAALDAYNADLDYSASIAKINADLAKAELEAAGDSTVKLWNYSGIDEDSGKAVYYDADGKKKTVEVGLNPYTGTKNSDAKYGVFDNGYQPNNVGGSKLSKSGLTDEMNGRTQSIWLDEDGMAWIWDGTKNRYEEYTVNGKQATKDIISNLLKRQG